MAFECHIIPTDIHIYITVEREGDLLAYNCYRDKEVDFAGSVSSACADIIHRCGPLVTIIMRSARDVPNNSMYHGATLTLLRSA
jgi:hypothetical protein